MLLILFLSLSLCNIIAADSEDQYFVPCQYTSHCTCPSYATVCTFDLVVEELSLFTQYPKNDLSLPLETGSSQHCTLSENGEYVMKNGSDCLCQSKDGCFGPIIADGKINRKFISVNRGLPGPTLIVHESQTVVVNVENRYKDKISIHWHGMHQKKTNWMDGVDQITQFGIHPGKKFRYIFKPFPTGTFWYHAHTKDQRVDGLFGALVILENTIDSSTYGEFLDIPELHTMTLLDWNVVEIDDGLVTYSSDGAEVGTDPFTSGLLNGKGKHPLVSVSQLSTFDVQVNQRYRFRIIGVQNYYGFRFSIDHHKLKLIAADGAFIKPIDVDYIIVHAGERYDFILETKSTSEIAAHKDFMIRAETLEVLVDDNNSSYQPNVKNPSHTYSMLLSHTADGILRYSSSNDIPDTQPYININSHTKFNSSAVLCSETAPCKAVNCPFKKFPDSYYIDCIHVHQLISMHSGSGAGHARPMSSPDKTIFLNFAFEGPGGNDSINGRSMKLPSYPPSLVLPPGDQSKITKCTNLDKSSQCDVVNTANDCHCPHIVSVGKDETIRMVLSSIRVKRAILDKEDPRKYFAHPVHIHGHYFRVVDIQFGEYHNGSSRLTAASAEPDCPGSRASCTNPQWKNKTSSIATGEKYSGSDGMILSSYPAKDTILVPAGGYAVVYFKSNNPGVWFLHCHIGDHQVTGMSLAISEDASNIGIPPLGLYDDGKDFNWTLDEFNFLLDDDSNTANVLVPNVTFLVSFLILFIAVTHVVN